MMQGIKDTSNWTFRRLLGNGLRYSIPKYQRDYSWDSEQWSDLWYDLMQMLNEADSHYMGYLVLQTNDDKNYHVIDGQQRITSISILLLAVINYLKTIGKDDAEKQLNSKRADTIHATYIGNLDVLTLTSENKIVLNRNNDDFYKNCLSALQEFPKRGLKNSDRLMKNAFEFFSSAIKNQYKTAEELVTFVEAIVDNLFFTVIIVTDDLNAFKVFETLNARGVQLSSSDLLKNYIFSVADSDKLLSSQIDSLDEKWAKITDILKETQIADFLRVYWNSTHKTVRKNQLYRAIRDEIKTSQQAFALLQDMQKQADVYMALKSPEDELWQQNMAIKEDLQLLKLFNVSQPISLLLIAYTKLSESQFAKLLHKIVIISFRYNVICNKNPNEQETAYNKLAMTLMDGNDLDLTVLKNALYVTDAEFEQIFAYKELPDNSRNNKIAKYILGKIEHFESSADIDLDHSTLEHILPDSPNPNVWHWADHKVQQFHYRLGNMTLLEYGKNKDLGNADFKTKKEAYKNSTIPMTKRIAESDIEEWTETEIDRRQQDFAKKAVGIWQF
ncbi:MAG: DUF262 domain-containing HNH endonuclease family protein [Treponemataceae bacterium]|nr:DUF262 domain-containing HNH endonuclease family protein [Treponemataceae bacterium]